MIAAPDALTPLPLALPTLQQLPLALARLCLGVERFARRQLGLARSSHLLLALSGGADSTALALIFSYLARRLDLRLSALSADHSLRPESSEDARHVQQLCLALDIPCSVRRCDVAAAAGEWGTGLEDAARRLRYALLEEERARLDADWILLGHHAGDLSEDVLLRLTRGTGWPGLAGMGARDDGRRLLRPLLFTSPRALRDFLRQLNVPWREDVSNSSLAFRRNRLRHEVLPLLRRENPALDRSMGALQRLGNLDAAYWEETLDNALKARPWQETQEDGASGLLLPRALLEGLHPAARLRLYVRACRILGKQNAKGGQGQPRASALLALDEALSEGRGNTRFQLPGGIEAKVRQDCIIFKTPVQPSLSNARAASVTPSASRP